MTGFPVYFKDAEHCLKLLPRYSISSGDYFIFHKSNSFLSILNLKQLIVVVLDKVLAEPVAGLEGLLADAADVGRMVHVLGLDMLNHVTLRSVQSLFTGCLSDCDADKSYSRNLSNRTELGPSSKG